VDSLRWISVKELGMGGGNICCCCGGVGCCCRGDGIRREAVAAALAVVCSYSWVICDRVRLDTSVGNCCC